MHLEILVEINLLFKTITLPGQSKPSNLHLDILMGRDELIDESNAFLPSMSPHPLPSPSHFLA
jgi:hypothetical protein